MDELLHLLKSNALETPENLAKMLGRTPAQVRKQIADCEKRGIIRGYRAVVNEDALDSRTVTAVIEVKVTPEREGGFDAVARRISKFPEVTSVYLMSGTFDLLLFVEGPDLKAVAFFVSEKLATIKGVISTSTHFMLKTYKDHGVVMTAPEENERLKVSP
jgi:DNA-binding Lrp family transcriptional regulator